MLLAAKMRPKLGLVYPLARRAAPLHAFSTLSEHLSWTILGAISALFGTQRSHRTPKSRACRRQHETVAARRRPPPLHLAPTACASLLAALHLRGGQIRLLSRAHRTALRRTQHFRPQRRHRTAYGRAARQRPRQGPQQRIQVQRRSRLPIQFSLFLFTSALKSPTFSSHRSYQRPLCICGSS